MAAFGRPGNRTTHPAAHGAADSEDLRPNGEDRVARPRAWIQPAARGQSGSGILTGAPAWVVAR